MPPDAVDKVDLEKFRAELRAKRDPRLESVKVQEVEPLIYKDIWSEDYDRRMKAHEQVLEDVYRRGKVVWDVDTDEDIVRFDEVIIIDQGPGPPKYRQWTWSFVKQEELKRDAFIFKKEAESKISELLSSYDGDNGSLNYGRLVELRDLFDKWSRVERKKVKAKSLLQKRRGTYR